MESNLFLSLIIFSSWILGDFSETIVEVPGDSMPCMQKLLPCQPYLLSSSPPSTTCCIPLKGMIANDPKCLCDIFDNPVLLKNLNITQDDALKLTTACGAKVDISVCKNAMAPATSPATPMSPTSPSKGSSSSNSTGSSTTKSSACGISHFGGSGFLILFASLFFLAF